MLIFSEIRSHGVPPEGAGLRLSDVKDTLFLIPVYVLLTIKTIICVFIALATSKVSVFPAAQFKMVKSCSILNGSLPRIYAPTCMSQSV